MRIRFIAVLAFLIALTVLAFFAIYFLVRPNAHDVTSEIDGSVSGVQVKAESPQLPQPWDPVGDANRRVEAIPFEDRAYPILAQAAAMLEVAETEAALWSTPGDEEWEDTAAWLRTEEAQSIIRVLDRAAEKPAFGVLLTDGPNPDWERARFEVGLVPETGEVSEGITPTDVLMPHIASLRDLVRLLMADAEIARNEGDPDRMLRRVETASRLSVLRSDLNTLLEQLVGHACIERILASVGRVLLDSPELLDSAGLERVEQSLRLFKQAGVLDTSFDSEAIMTEDLLRRIVDQNGRFNATAVAQMHDSGQAFGLLESSSVVDSSIEPEVLAVLYVSRRQVEAAERAARPAWSSVREEVDAWNAFVDQPSGVAGKIAKLVGELMQPAWAKFIATHRRVNSDLLATRVALAAHRHHLRHGQPPASLDAIDPDLLTFEPIDGFTGGRLVYRWTESGHLVYAAGPDGDDDGGRPIESPADADWGPGISDRLIEDKPDGDYVLFPAQD